MMINFVSGILFFKNSNVQTKDSAAIKSSTINLRWDQHDQVTFTSRKQRSFDINNDDELKLYIQRQVNIADDYFIKSPNLLKSVRKLLYKIPDFEENPPEFKLRKSVKKGKERLILIAAFKNNLNTPIWTFGYNSPIKDIELYEKNLLGTFNKEEYKNIHEGIKQFFERNVHSEKENLANERFAEETCTVIKNLSEFLLKRFEDDAFINFLNSKHPVQVEDFLYNGAKYLINI